MQNNNNNNNGGWGTLGAPIAHFDEGFSSDGAFLSGAETEKEATPTESDGAKTPMYELPRAERTPFGAKNKKTNNTLSPEDDYDEPIVDSGLDHVVYSHSEEDLLKSIVSSSSAPKETDEARTSLLMQQESFDTDFDECISQSESYKTPPTSSTIMTNNQFNSSINAKTSSIKQTRNNKSSVNNVTSSSYVDLDTNENQLRKEFEIQATSRPRCTTPVRSCVIEDFIASSQQQQQKDDLYERQKMLENEKLIISIPGTTGTLDDQQQGKSKSGGRRSSKSWSEFYENMAVSSMSGRTSGRTTPLSGELADPGVDMFEKNPAYQHKVPPSPVVHRRSSTDWVNFDAKDDEKVEGEGGYGDDSVKNGGINDRFTQSQPPLSGQWQDEGGFNIPAVAAAVSASIAAMSHDDYYTDEFTSSGQKQITTADSAVIQSDQDQQQTSDQFNASWTEVNEAEQFPDGSTSNVEFEYNQNRSQYPESVSAEINPAYVSETGYPDYPIYDNYTMPNEESYSTALDTNYSSALDTSYTGQVDNYPDISAASNYPDYNAQQTTDYYEGSYEQSFTNYPATTWDEDAAANPGEPIGQTYEPTPPWTDNASTFPNDNVSSTSYEPASVYTDYLTSWDDTPQTVSSVNGGGSRVYQEPSYPSWDDDESAAPPPPSFSKPPWAYQDYAPPEATESTTKSDTSVPEAPEPPAKEEKEKQPTPADVFIKNAAVLKRLDSDERPKDSQEWLEYQKMTDKINAIMKQTQEKLQEINKTSVAKELPTRPIDIYSMSTSQPQKSTPENLMDMEITTTETKAATPQTDPKSDWKPIHERLNEEIQKQKELNKPRRPPPPKGAPKRPPPPSAAKAKPAYPTSWDDEEVPPPPPALSTSTKSYDYNAAWDDDSTSSYSYPPPAATATAQQYYNEPSDKKSNIGDLGEFDTGLNAMEDSSSSVLLPPPPLDIYQTQSISPVSGVGADDELPPPPPIPPQEIIVHGDEDIFNVDKYSSMIVSGGDAGKPATSELDDFFGGIESKKQVDRSEYENVYSAVQPPVPPPRSPMTESRRQQVTNWENTNFDDAALPSSDSGFFAKVTDNHKSATNDPFAPQSKQPKVDLFGSLNEEESVMQESYDPFDVKPIDVIVAEVKSKTQAAASALEAQDDLDFFGQANHRDHNDDDSSVPHAPSPPLGFADEFQPDEREDENRTPSPLFDEDDTLPLKDYPEKYTGDGWELMLRYPAKKKIMGERYWKAVFVSLSGNTIQLYYSRNDKRPFQELPLQSNYCMSDITLQQYDIYGKIHTVKVQYVQYKERVGVRPGQIPKLVEGKFSKLGLPLEHAAQTTVLLKFGSLNHNDMQSFVNCIEDVLFKIPSARERPCLYKQDEIQVHCYDEYSSYVNKDGVVSDQRARVRLFCLAFVSGMPYIEIGLNDRRRQGKEVVRRKDIMPMYTERWIRFEALDFHSSVEKPAYDTEHVIKMRPLDATFFEVLRFRVRPPRGKELPLQVRAIMKLAGSKVEIRLEVLVAMFKSRKARQVPCEDIQIRFPIPEAWIYLFREERHWGYGSVHAKIRRPGKVKNIKDRLMGMVQHVETSLIEAAIGDAKYEHVYRSLVWRIPKLPEKHHGAYKTHLLRCRFELNSFDLMPESFMPNCEVEYTMPVATVSHTVVRSVSLEQNDDPDKVEKWVRYLAKYQYKVEIDYVQTTDLDIDAILDTTVMEPEKSLDKTPVMHKPSIDVDVAKEAHGGYRIEFAPGEFGDENKEKVKNDSSSESDDDMHSHKPPLININMKGYGY